MKKKKINNIFIKMLLIIMVMFLSIQVLLPRINSLAATQDNYDYQIDLSDLSKYTTYSTVEELETAKTNGSLPEGIYITKFIYDGVDAYKTYDLDDFIENGNDMTVKTLSKTVVNINTTGKIEIKGSLTGGVILVNTNDKKEDINLYLNNVTITTKDDDEKGKKCPAIYVYNKDRNYTDCKVTIKTVSGTKNSITGGKFKKVSLINKEELSSFSDKYKSTNNYSYEEEDESGNTTTKKIVVSELYSTYTNYYGVYTKEQIDSILFAKLTADEEDLSEGDPYYFYKGSGAISSDIDLYFEGEGELEVTSNKNEGIETKGNLTFSGGKGDYTIFAEDDCLNTTTSKSELTNARNTLTIDVNSLTAIVDNGEDADEGDAIDSNGTLTINGGRIIAIAHTGQDAGLDSESGTYINGGTILATGDMYDQISNDSKQNFMVLTFSEKPTENTIITLLDEKDNTIMAYKTDRSYSNLVYSSEKLKEGTYYLYKDGEVSGTDVKGFYNDITKYNEGTMLGYSQNGNQMSGVPSGNRGEAPSGNEPINSNIPNQGDSNLNQGQQPLPENSSSNNQNSPPDIQGQGNNDGNYNNNTSATNKEFKISGISNQFSGVGTYTESTNENNENNGNINEDTTVSEKELPNTGLKTIIMLLIPFTIIILYSYNKYKKSKKNI